MADRPSVKEILAAARSGGTATGPAKPAPAEPPPEPAPAAPASASGPAPASASTAGRPLTLQEKLAAARAGGAGTPRVVPEVKAAPRAPAAPEVLETPAEGFTTVAELASIEPEPASGRPLILKEKLAAARTGGAPAPSPAGAPAVADPPAPEAAQASGEGRPLSVKEKLAAARAGGGATPTLKTPAAQKPKIEGVPDPAKPTSREPKALAQALRSAAEAAEKRPAAKVEKVETAPAPTRGRRGFLIGGAAAAALIGGLAWLVRKVLAEPPRTVKVGPASGLAAGSVLGNPAWDFVVVQRSGRIFALRSACTHLGCSTHWAEAESRFRCPCHGSAFDPEGVNVEGPAPRPLERYKVALASDGQVVVDRSRTFRKELGEWDDPGSFVETPRQG